MSPWAHEPTPVLVHVPAAPVTLSGVFCSVPGLVTGLLATICGVTESLCGVWGVLGGVGNVHFDKFSSRTAVLA